MRGRPKKVKTTENLVNSQYDTIAHCYYKLENAIHELREAVASIQVQYERLPHDDTVKDKVYQIDRKMVFDNITFNINGIELTMNEYIGQMVRQADDMKWSDHVKEEEK